MNISNNDNKPDEIEIESKLIDGELLEKDVHKYEFALVMYNLKKYNSEYIDDFLKSKEFNSLKQNSNEVK